MTKAKSCWTRSGRDIYKNGKRYIYIERAVDANGNAPSSPVEIDRVAVKVFNMLKKGRC